MEHEEQLLCSCVDWPRLEVTAVSPILSAISGLHNVASSLLIGLMDYSCCGVPFGLRVLDSDNLPWGQAAEFSKLVWGPSPVAWRRHEVRCWRKLDRDWKTWHARTERSFEQKMRWAQSPELWGIMKLEKAISEGVAVNVGIPGGLGNGVLHRFHWCFSKAV